MSLHGHQKIASCPQKPSDEQLRKFGHSQHSHLGRVDQPVKKIAASDFLVEYHDVEKRYAAL